MDVRKVGIIGAGRMGGGIAQVCALAGFDVVLKDISEEKVRSALATINGHLARAVKKKRIKEAQREAALEKITPVDGYEPFAECDIIIEAATESEETKRRIFRELCPHLPPATIIATNTSSLSITRLAAATDRPEKFMGMHFMNPAPAMELVELIRGIATSEETFNTVRDFAHALGKTPAVSDDSPAFIVNRILLPMINEAIYALHEGVGTVTDIDTAMKLGAHHPMGPLQLADFIGLDVVLNLMQTLYEGLADSKYRPCPLLVKYVDAGWLGRKTKRGFYDYSGETPVPTR